MTDSEVVKQAIIDLLSLPGKRSRATLIAEHIETLIDLRMADLMDELSKRLEALKAGASDVTNGDL